MTTGNLHCRIEIRTRMKPLLILAALTRWNWLMERCISVTTVKCYEKFQE